MSVSMYDASVSVFREGLDHCSAILENAKIDASRRGADLAVFVNGRLYPDMYPLTQQVRGVATLAMVVSSKLANRAGPVPSINADDPKVGFDDYQVWIRLALDFLQQLEPSQFADAAERHIVFPLKGVPCTFTGKSFLLRFGLPNFFFHATVLYAILRHLGVPLGKSDFVLPEFAGSPATFA